jgi:hypothetical protein
MSGTYRIQNVGTQKYVEIGKGSNQCLQIDGAADDAFCYASADKAKSTKHNP